MKRFLTALFLLMVFAAPVRAQVFDLNFIVAVPQGEFSDHVDVGFGIKGSFLVPIGTSPLHVGIDGGFLTYGQESSRVPLSPTIPHVTVGVETSNNIAFGHLLLRVQPQQGRIRPYADGLFGFKYLFTETSVEDLRDDEPVFSSTNFDDWTMSYGGGVGVDIHLHTSVDEEDGSITKFYLDLGARYILGGEAEYLKEGSIQSENGQVTYDTIQSKTDMLIPHLGVRFVF